MKPKALYLADPVEAAHVFGPDEWADLDRRVEWVLPIQSVEQTVAQFASAGATEVIFSSWGVPLLDAGTLARLPRLRAVFHAAGTVKTFTSEALWARGIRVTCAARLNAVPVAEFTVSQIIFCLKRGWHHVRTVRTTGRFQKHDPLMRGVYDSTVGLISLGHTGRLVAEMLKPLDVRVIAFDPTIAPETAGSLGVELVPLDDLFARSDVVSCHTPLLPETTGMLRRAHFAAMRAGASFINTARGAVVNEPDLIAVLRARPDLTAVLDVTDPEPPAPDSPLFHLPNAVVTPHIAGSLGAECRRLGRMMIEEFDRFVRGKPLEGELTATQLAVSA
jgi:phosphoglycerate dehydrogenase-like enzyme